MFVERPPEKNDILCKKQTFHSVVKDTIFVTQNYNNTTTTTTTTTTNNNNNKNNNTYLIVFPENDLLFVERPPEKKDIHCKKQTFHSVVKDTIFVTQNFNNTTTTTTTTTTNNNNNTYLIESFLGIICCL